MPITIPGKSVKLRGEREVIIPPVTVRTIRKFTKSGQLAAVMAIAERKGLPTDEQWGALVSLVTETLQANEPKITEEEVEELLDFGNLMAVIDALFSASGFKKDLPPGEGQGPSTGTPSSPTS